MAGDAGLDYEIDSRNGRVLANLGGEIRLEYEQMSPSRAEIVCSEPPDLPPLSRLTIYHNSAQGRVPVWLGWFTTARYSRQGTSLTFLGAREILRFAPIQAIFFRQIAIGDAFRLIVNSAVGSILGIDLSDWRVSSDCGIPMQMLDLRDIGDAAEAIRRLEELAPGWRATFAFGSDGYFWARMLQKPSMGEILCPGDIIEYEEDYGSLTNRLQILMPNHEAGNLVPNGDFSNPIPLEAAAANLVPNPSFENPFSDWTTPANFYFEWDNNYGYTGNRNFKFHDCAEYSSTGWLISGRFPVSPDTPYVGGFAYGCDPYLAQECVGGYSSVKLKYEIRGYDIDGNYTETPVQGEITGNFHAAFHWHWVDIEPFTFSNPDTSQAEIRFLTFHGKRLYLDEVQVHEHLVAGQEGWLVTTSGGATADVDWFRPEGPSKYHYVSIVINAGSGQEVRLEQEPGTTTAFKPGLTLYFQILYASLAPQLDVEWLNSSGGVISSQNIPLTSSLYENDDFFLLPWYQAKGSAVPPAGAVALRIILKWSNVQAMSFVRAVSVSYIDRALAPAYGYSPSAIYDSDAMSYPAEADADFVLDAAYSQLTYGILPAILIRDDIPSDAIAEEFARWYFLRRALPARTIRIAGASIDDVRILQPQFYRWRIPIGGTSRRYIVERLIIRHDGSWEAECGEYLPDASQLLAAIYKRKISG